MLGQIFDLISSFLSNIQLEVVPDGKSSEEYSVNAGEYSFLVLHILYYKLTTFLMMLFVILPSMLMILLSTLNVIRHVICGNK